MSSSPRLRRGRRAAQAGTSIIAALVFAAVLGAIALSLNSLQSGSSNTAALSAAANTAVAGAKEQPCADGYDYALTVGASYSTQLGGSGDVNIVMMPSNIPETQLKQQQMCPSSAQALQDAQAKYLHTNANGQLVGTLAPTFPEKPLAQRNQCNNGKLTTAPITCNYNLVGNSYQLQTAVPKQTGPWTCRVSFYDQNGTTPAEQCWVKDVPVGSGVNETLPGSPGSGERTVAPGVASNPYLNGTYPPSSNAAVSPDALTPSTGIGACTNGATDSPACTTCPDGMTMQSGSCQTVPAITPAICQSNGTCGIGWCGNGASDAPPSGTCSQCPTGTAMQNDICQSATAAPPPNPQPCTNGATNPPTCTSPQVCANGATNYPTCTPQVVPPPHTTCPAGMTCAPATQTQNGSNPLTSLLSGFAKGLAGSNCTPTAQNQYAGGNGTTIVPVQVLDPQTGQVTTVYVQQQQTGTNSAGQPCIPSQAQPQPQQQPSQQAPYGTGTNGAVCPAPPIAPQCAQGATAQPVSATGNGCMTGYQCVPTAGSTISQTPTPQISCSPQVADVGQSVAIAYSCQNATGSSGGGFSTNNQTSGSASSTITAPPSGSNTANFGITCTGSGQSASAQCSVQVNQPAIDLVADPQSVPAGQTTSIGWVTAGMKSCVISSAQDTAFTQANAGITNVNGVAQSDAITATTEFDLTCQTLGGQTKKASTTVKVGSAPASASVSVASTADGATVNHGDPVTITWSSSSTPANSAIALWLIDINTEEATALIAGARSANGTYQWQLPAAGSACDQSTIAPCASDLVAGSSYGLEAAIYTPQNAYLGLTVPSGSVGPSYIDYGYTASPFMVGQ